MDVGRLVKILLAAVVILAVVGGYTSFLWQYYARAAELERARNELAAVNPVAGEVDRLAAESKRNEQRSEALEALLLGQVRWARVLNDLNHNLPADVFLLTVRAEHVKDVPVAGGFASPPGFDPEAAAGKKDQQEEKKSDTKAKAKAKKDEAPKPKSLPLPNVVIVKGVVQSTASMGVLINNLHKMSYFETVRLKSLEEDISVFKGHKIFEIEAYLKGAGISVAATE